jgi:ATP-dependent Lhr-like helicase
MTPQPPADRPAGATSPSDDLPFGPATSRWFAGAFAAPTPAQTGAWEAAASGEHALVVAPTGSGKTLAAFLWALDDMATRLAPPKERRTRVLYVSPLKALGADVERNLRLPLAGIEAASAELGLDVPDIRVGVRSGDTTPAERRRLLTRPPDILITTPESLYLMLTSRARETLASVETVIVDEVHAIAGTKRGAHLFLSLERLDALTARPVQRIGLSATVRPAQSVAAALAGARTPDDGGRPVRVVSPPASRRLDLSIVLPAASLTNPGPPPGAVPAEAGDVVGDERTTIWPHVAAAVVDQVLAHRSTIVFAGSRRLAERLAAQINEEHDRRQGGPGPAAEGAAWSATMPAQSGTSLGLPAVLARAHHGSMSASERRIAEEALKSGELRCVVATATLELGIDMGDVDLVLQVGSPPTIASAVQRVGRAGHHVGGTSRGILVPVHRADLLPSLVAAEQALAGAVEPTEPLRSPLDVLAQQLLAMVATEELDVEEAYRRVRRARSFADLPRAAFDSVLDMLSGRYPAEEFKDLRPRIVYDRTTGMLRARPGAARLAIVSGGTIPDRGLYRVVLAGDDGGQARRVGELDEEMVFESRVGDTFTLGNSTWRIEQMTADRVLVSPATGRPGRVPFWLGDTLGRPAELGRAIGRAARTWSDDDVPPSGLTVPDETVAEIGDWLREQREATGVVPSDRDIVVESFLDELGDVRVVIHSPFGRRVNAPWALVISAVLASRSGTDAQVFGADDGIVLRMPPGEGEDLGAADLLMHEDEVREQVVGALAGSSLLATRFRQAAARSLLLPRRFPDKRQPLWQQRHRAAALFDVARRFDDFPVTLEAVREVLQEDYDVDALASLMGDIAARDVRVVEVRTNAPSPWARSLLLGYTARFLYGDDAPPAERRAAALTLDTSLLSELLGEGQTDLADILDPRAVADVAAEAGLAAEMHEAGDVEGAFDLVRRLGPIGADGLADRLAPGLDAESVVAELLAAGRIARVTVAGETRFVVVEDVGLVVGALGIDPPAGVAAELAAPVAEALERLVRRFAQTHGPFTTADCARWLGLADGEVDATLATLTADGTLVAGRITPRETGVEDSAGAGSADTELVDADLLRRMRRRSLHLLRGQVDAVDHLTLSRAALAWHGIGASGDDRAAAGDDEAPSDAEVESALLEVVDRLAGQPLPVAGLDTHVLPSRVPAYRPRVLDDLIAAGEVVWVGRGPHRGRAAVEQVVLLPADAVADLAPPLTEPSPPQPGDDEAPSEATLRGVLRVLRDGATRTVHDIAAEIAAPDPDDPWDLGEADVGGAIGDTVGPSGATPSEVTAALWWLAADGLVTSDSLAQVRARAAGGAGRSRSRPTRPARAMRGGLRRQAVAAARPSGGRYASLRAAPALPADAAGRWSLVRRGADTEPDPTLALASRVSQLVETHGLLVRESAGIGEIAGGFSAAYQVLSRLEDSGRIRRGYAVDGLGGAQFALPAMLDLLHAHAQVGARERAGDGRPSGERAHDDDAPGGRTHDKDESGGSAGHGHTSDKRSPRKDVRDEHAPDDHAPAVVLAASDPANVWGAALPWPRAADEDGVLPRPSRRPGAFVVLVDGRPAIELERGGKSLLSLTTDPGDLTRAVGALTADVRAGRLPHATLRRIDGDPPSGPRGSALERALADAGWVRGPGGLHPPG